MGRCYRVTKPDGLLVVNVGSKRHLGRYYPISMDIYHNMTGWELLDKHVWIVPNALPQPNHYMDKLPDNKHEDLLIFGKNHDYQHTFNKPRVRQKYRNDPRPRKLHPEGRSLGNVFKIPAYRPPNIQKQNYHEAAFPESLAWLVVSSFTNEGDTVLDPFLGSGTTLKVCQHTNRRGIGFEVNPDNQPLIEQRINEHWELPKFDSMDVMG